jgi:hypothetical protein
VKSKIYCEVCRVSFVYREEPVKGQVVVCTVCGAELEITDLEPEVKARRYPQDPETEIRNRSENYARLRGYTFNEDKELVIEGLIGKHQMYGDFYCPCRFDNTPENICPCLPTRMGDVKSVGHCF